MRKENHNSRQSPAAVKLFFGLAWAMVLCVTVQIFIAGLAIFTDSSYWSGHRTLVHFMELVPVIMLIVALAGKLPTALKWQSFILLALIFIQYFTAHFPGAGAVHPVIAMILFALSLHVAQRSSRMALRKDRHE